MDEKNEAKVCFETIKSTLDGIKWNYDVKEDFLIATSANGDNMAIPLFIGIDADKPAIYIHSPMPYKVSADNVDKIARAVCEANFSMLIGSFDLDTRNNRIVFKATLPFMESLISEATCKYMILLACYMADRFNLKFLELDKGDITLEQFIEYVQKN